MEEDDKNAEKQVIRVGPFTFTLIVSWFLLGGFLGCSADLAMNWKEYSRTLTGIGETFRIVSFLLSGLASVFLLYWLLRLKHIRRSRGELE